MKILQLHRVTTDEQGTFGVLLDGYQLPLCVTVEDAWRNNQAWHSCIPEGTYFCEAYASGKFGNVWEVMEVPDRTDILWHAGNTIADTQGCILPGLKFGMLGNARAVLDSKDALRGMKSHIGFTDSFVLIVENHFEKTLDAITQQ